MLLLLFVFSYLILLANVCVCQCYWMCCLCLCLGLYLFCKWANMIFMWINITVIWLFYPLRMTCLTWIRRFNGDRCFRDNECMIGLKKKLNVETTHQTTTEMGPSLFVQPKEENTKIFWMVFLSLFSLSILHFEYIFWHAYSLR